MPVDPSPQNPAPSLPLFPWASLKDVPANVAGAITQAIANTLYVSLTALALPASIVSSALTSVGTLVSLLVTGAIQAGGQIISTGATTGETFLAENDNASFSVKNTALTRVLRFGTEQAWQGGGGDITSGAVGGFTNLRFYSAGSGTATLTMTGPSQAAAFANGLKLSAGTLAIQSTGAAPECGNAVLVGGTVTVATTAVTANSKIILTRKTSGGTIGTAITYSINAGVGFTITSDNVLDTSTFTWVILEGF